MDGKKTSAKAATTRALSEIVIEIARIGFKAPFRNQDPTPVKAHILMLLAVEAWNREIGAGLKHTEKVSQTIEKMRSEFGLTQAEFQRQFISTDWETILEMMQAYKRRHFQKDTRKILGCGYTDRGTLRVVWE